MSPELEYVRRETERATREVSAEALSHAPNGKWSPSQVLEHLVLSYTATTKGLLRSTQSGEMERGAGLVLAGPGCLCVGLDDSRASGALKQPSQARLGR